MKTFTFSRGWAYLAKIVAFNGRIVTARAGQAGKEFAVVAAVLLAITIEMDDMVRVALQTT